MCQCVCVCVLFAIELIRRIEHFLPLRFVRWPRLSRVGRPMGRGVEVGRGVVLTWDCACIDVQKGNLFEICWHFNVFMHFVQFDAVFCMLAPNVGWESSIWSNTNWIEAMGKVVNNIKDCWYIWVNHNDDIAIFGWKSAKTSFKYAKSILHYGKNALMPLIFRTTLAIAATVRIHAQLSPTLGATVVLQSWS